MPATPQGRLPQELQLSSGRWPLCLDLFRPKQQVRHSCAELATRPLTQVGCPYGNFLCANVDSQRNLCLSRYELCLDVCSATVAESASI